MAASPYKPTYSPKLRFSNGSPAESTAEADLTQLREANVEGEFNGAMVSVVPEGSGSSTDDIKVSDDRVQ